MKFSLAAECWTNQILYRNHVVIAYVEYIMV